MKNLRVSNRYAKALLGLAEENDISGRAFEDMKLVFSVLDGSKELQTVLKSPIIRIAKKINILNAIFENKLHPMSLHYLNIITRKRRAALIMGIAFEYLKLYRNSLDIESVTMITAGEITEELTSRAKEIALTLTPKANIEFNHVYDASLIGGFILKIGDLYYDASIKRKLANIQKQLLQS